MSRRWLAALALIAALGLVTPNLMADQGKGKSKGKGNPHSQHSEKSYHNDRHDSRGDRHDHDDDRGWDRRDGHEVRIYEVRHHHRPPGWSRGKKVGWNHCGMPPGLAKKYGCYSYVYRERRYYYYHDDHDRIIVRRPSIEVRAVIR